jgi:2',3'-cyclic-nucleotide 2'-phosphodiesterase (5'-nucleotidase family)
MLKETKKAYGKGKVISMLTGDFLSPYLLSSIDNGAGMMNALAKTPIDYLTWGNHEADIDHSVVCEHVKNFPGTWINTNMQDHEAMKYQTPFEIIEVTSPDGEHTRKIGLIAVLSDDPNLYKQFGAPGAFGGATITDPWEILREYKAMLESPPYNCDLIIPLQHLYVPDDTITCRDFDFPVILSGHDHHRVDEVIHGTRLLKPGSDASQATLLDICWQQSDAVKPKIVARFVKMADWEPDPELKEECDRAYDVLLPLRNTELASIDSKFEPLSSSNARASVCTMGKLISTLLRSSLNIIDRGRNYRIDAVLLMGGNIRGSQDYPEGSFFSLEALEAEVKSDEVIGVVDMPGWVLSKAISETHEGDPIPGWMQYDANVTEVYPEDGGPSFVTHVGGLPIEPEHLYRVATKISDLTNGQSPTMKDYYTQNPKSIPPKGNYINIHAELMGYFARNMWKKIWESIEALSSDSEDSSNEGSQEVEEVFEQLDRNNDGTVSVEDIQVALRDHVGLSVHNSETTLAEAVHAVADIDNDGKVTLADLEKFCEIILPDVLAQDSEPGGSASKQNSALCESSLSTSNIR